MYSSPRPLVRVAAVVAAMVPPAAVPTTGTNLIKEEMSVRPMSVVPVIPTNAEMIGIAMSEPTSIP